MPCVGGCDGGAWIGPTVFSQLTEIKFGNPES